MAEFEDGINLPQTNNLTPPPGVPSDAFEFESVRDLEIPPNLEVFDDALDSNYEMLMAEQASIINSLPGFETTGNMNSPYPSGGRNNALPNGSKMSTDLSSADGVLNFMKGIEALPAEMPDEPKIADPIYIGSRDSNFDRYYNHGDFGELGFNPSIDNETYYNANTNWFQEMGRMFPQFARTMGTGFLSSYRAMGDLFDGGPSDYFSEKDLTSAIEYADANRIGSSTSGGAWATNFTLNMGYSMGIIANIAVEEAALFGLAALQGGLNPASDAALVARTGYNVKRFFSAIGNAFSITKALKASRNLLMKLNRIENFKSFGQAVKVGGNVLGDLLAPETVRAFKQLGTAGKTVENMTDLAKAGKILAGAYRDFRSLNMAMSESKMEGGMVFNNVLANGYSAKVLENQAAGLGSELTPDQFKEISDNANKASFSTIMRNAPLIYLTNQITLGTAFGGFKRSLPQAMRQGFEGLARRQIRSKAIRTAEGTIAKDVFEDVGESLMEDMFGVFSKQGFKKLKALGLKGSLQATAGGALRYFAANFSEGAQELYQEAVANGVENYYNALMFDPSRDEAELYRASVNSALSSQWSSEGIQTFLSGFMMGGAMQGPQNLIFKGAPNLFSYVKDKQGYMDAAKKRDAEAARITKEYNDAWNQQALDIGYIFDTNVDAFVKQNQTGKESTFAQYEGDHMANIDSKHFAKFDFLVNLAKSGNVNLFREQLDNMLEMTDAELGAAFPSATKSEIKSGKIRTRIQDMIQKSQEIEKLVSESKDDSPNPHNPNKFQPGTREHGEEMRAYIAWEHVRYLKLFTKDALVNAGERRLKIMESMASHPVLGKIAANQLTVLLTKTGIEAEMSRLAGEISVIENTKENKETLDTMANRLTLLASISEVLHSPENATALKGRRKGAFDMRSFKKKLRGPLYEYLKHLAGSQDDVVVTDEIDNALTAIIDFQHLDSRQDKYFMALEMLENPQELDRLRTRSKEYLEEYYKNRLVRFREIIDQQAFKKDIKDFLGKLAEKGVFINQREFNEFIKTGDLDVIKSFYSEQGQLNPIDDPELLRQVIAVREQFRDILLSQHKAKTEAKAETIDESKPQSQEEIVEELEEWEEENGVEIDDDITLYGEEEENPVLKALLKNKYRKYVSTLTNLKKRNPNDKNIPTPLKFNDYVADIVPKLKYVEAYKKLKSLWGSDLKEPNKNKRDKIYKNDIGFLKWLALRAEDPQVVGILMKDVNLGEGMQGKTAAYGDLKITDFLESYESPSMRKDSKGKRKVTLVKNGEGKSFGVKKVTPKNNTGEKLTAYTVVNLATGKRASAADLEAAGIERNAFKTVSEAKKAMGLLDASVEESKEFTFDGKEFSYGQIITKGGQEYIVLSKAGVVKNSKDGYILIAPLEAYNKAIEKGVTAKKAGIREKINYGEAKDYEISELTFEQSSSNKTKIRVDEPTKIMPYRERGESDAETDTRFSLINQILTQEEIENGLSIVVKRNNVGPNTPRRLQSFQDKEKNSQVVFMQEPLEIALVFDDVTFAKLEAGFEELGVGVSPSKTFGFLKNSTVQIKDSAGNAINPISITPEIVKETFIVNGNIDAVTETIQKNFAIQNVYLRAIYDKLDKADSAELKLSDIEDFNINMSAGSMNFTAKGVETLLSNLNFNTVEGSKVIFVTSKSLVKGKVVKTTKMITDFEGESQDEEFEFEERIKAELTAQNPNMIKNIEKAGRYVMITKTQNGKYSYAPIKTTRVDKADLNEIFGEMLDAAKEVRKNNFAKAKKGSKETRVEDKSQRLKLSDKFGGLTLAEWNAEMNDEFFIAGIPGYNFELNVTTNGHLNLSIYDIKKEERIDVYIDKYETIENYSGADNQIELLETLLKLGKDTAGSIEYGEVDINLSIDNIRKSIDRTEKNLDEIFENSSTTLSALMPRKEILLRANVDSVDVQDEINLAANLEGNVEPITDNKSSSTKKGNGSKKQDQNDIELYTDEEFDDIFDNDLQDLDAKELEFIARKLHDHKKGIIKKLSPRYEKIRKSYRTNEGIKEQLDTYMMALAQKDNNPQSEALDTKKSINKRLSEIANEITSIEDEFDLSVDEDEINEDPRIKKLRAEEKDLIAKRKDANKIISPDLNVDDVEDIDVFLAWAKENLPGFMQIVDIEELGNNLKKGGVRVGAFVLGMRDIAGGMEVDGTLYTGAKSPFRYHEAFHGVFRMLLSKEKQDELYAISQKEVLAKMRSKKGYEISEGVFVKSMDQAIELLKNSADTYQGMSIEELRKEVLEEYMADGFEKFKKDAKSAKTDGVIKSFFTRLLEWIKSIFTSFNSTELKPIFQQIDSGAFKYASIAENGFIDSARSGVVLEANAIVPYDTFTDEYGDEVNRVLTADVATAVVHSIAARVVHRQMHFKPTKKQPNFDVVKEVEESFQLHKKLYSVKNPVYKDKIILKTADQKKKLRTLSKAFENNEKALREGVINYMQLFDVKLSLEQDSVDEFEMEFGLRSSSQYDKDASMIGGFNSLSKEIRQYFATTTMLEKDFLGNDILDPETGEKIIVPVDYAAVYNGFMQVGSGSKSSLELLQRLWMFSRDNANTRAVADRMFEDLNITGDEVMAGDLSNLDSVLAPMIISGFTNFKTQNLFIHRVNNFGQDNHEKVYTYSAANRDDVNKQVESWAVEWRKRWRSIKDGGDIELLNKGTNALRTLIGYLSKERKTMTNGKLDEVSKKISSDLYESLGISLAPLFIKVAIVKNIKNPTKGYQEGLQDMYTDKEMMNLEDIEEIYDALIAKNEDGKPDPANIFDDADRNTYSRIRNVSRLNGQFDENIGISMFNNPNGDLVYAHQLPSFNLKQLEALNRHDELMDKIEREHPNDPILNSPAFKAMSRKKLFQVYRVSGIKESAFLEKKDDDSLVVGTVNDQGETYGDLNPKEFAAAMINAYLGSFNDSKGTVDNFTDDDGNEHGISPHLLRVAEASNTGDMAGMAVIQAVEKDSSNKTVLTDKAVGAIIQNVETEFDRIVDEFGRNPTQDRHEGYNVKNGILDEENGRAFKFHNNETALTPLNFGSKDLGKASEIVMLKDEFDLLQETEENDAATNLLLRDQQVPGHRIEGTVKNILITPFDRPTGKSKKNTYYKDQQSLLKMRYQGPIAISELTEQEIINKLEPFLNKDKTDVFGVEVKIGTRVFHTTTGKVKKLIENEGVLYAYEKVDENAESEIRELKGYAEELVEEIKKARDAKTLDKFTLDDALKAMGSNREELEAFIRTRMDQEFAAFQLLLDDIGVKDKDISIDIRRGVESISSASKSELGKTNRLMNLTDDKDYNLKQIFINDFINTKALNKLIMGDEALSLKDAVDQVKRNKGAIAAYYSAKSDLPINKSSRDLGITEQIDEVNLLELTEPVVNRTYNDGETEYADAQAYMTIKGFRYTYFAFGKLHPGLATLLDKVEKGEKVTSEEYFAAGGKDGMKGYAKMQHMLNSKKYVYYDGKKYLKMSVQFLAKEYTSVQKNGKWVAKRNMRALHNLRVNLEKSETPGKFSLAAPASAIKMMKTNLIDHKDMLSGEMPADSLKGYGLDPEYLGLQVINPSNKLIITDPNQIKTLITGQHNPNSEVIMLGYNGNQPVPISKVIEMYNRGIQNRQLIAYTSKRNIVFNLNEGLNLLSASRKKGKIDPDLNAFLKYAAEGLMASGSNTDLLPFFTTDPDTGEQQYDLNNPRAYDTALRLFMTFFNKSVISEKTPGISAALVSDMGVRVFRKVLEVDEDGKPMRSEIIRETDFRANYSDSDISFDIDDNNNFETDVITGLKSAVENSKGKGVIIVDRLRHGMMQYDPQTGEPTGTRYTEVILPAHTAEEHDLLYNTTTPIPEVVAKKFGIRIPSQDMHSAINVMVVDMSPTFYGSSVVSARELVELSGADFDIDKLYMQMKEYYVGKSGTFVEYGSIFEHYAIYQNQDVKKKGSTLSEAADKYDKLGLKKLNKAKLEELEQNNIDLRTYKALTVLGLPTNKSEYAAWVENNNGQIPYSAAINNMLLDLKFALLGESSISDYRPVYIDNVTGEETYDKETRKKKNKKALDASGKQKMDKPLHAEPADLKPLTEAWKDMEEEFPELAEAAREDGLDVNNLRAKTMGFANNKAGAKSIGAVVLPNLYLSLLTEYKIPLKSLMVLGEEVQAELKFNGRSYSTYGVEFEQLENGTRGQRKQYIISALITAMTDNAKERLAKKLELNISSLGTVSNMIALGVPLSLTLRMLNSPVIAANYKEAELQGKQFIGHISRDSENDKGSLALITRMIATLDPKMEKKELAARTDAVNVSTALVSESISDPIDGFMTEIEADQFANNILEQEDSDYTKQMIEKLIDERALIMMYLRAAQISEGTRHIKNLMNLAAGYDKEGKSEIPDVINAIKMYKLALSDKDYNKLKPEDTPIVDIRKIFGISPGKVAGRPPGGTWQSNMVKMFADFYSLLPNVFMPFTESYKIFVNSIESNSDTYKLYSGQSGKKLRKMINNDVLSFLTLKAYMHKMQNSKNGAMKIASLNQDLLYGDNAIDIMLNEASDLFGDEAVANTWLQDFAEWSGKTFEGNDSGIAILEHDTFKKLSYTEKLNSQIGLLNILGNPATSDIGRSIIYYTMVKEGLQSRYKSVSKSITPDLLTEFLDVIPGVHQAMMSDNKNDHRKVFGASLEDLLDEYTTNYMMASSSTVLTTTKGYSAKNGGGRYLPESLVYDPFSESTVSSKHITREMAKDNPNTVYVIFDNENRTGQAGSLGARNEFNVVSITSKKRLGIEEDAYFTDEEEQNEMIVELQNAMQKLDDLSEGRDVVFQPFIGKKEAARLKKHSPIFYDELLNAITERSYKFYQKTKTVKDKKTGKNKTITVKDNNPLTSTIYLDKSRPSLPVLRIDLFKRFGLSEKYKESNKSQIYHTPSVAAKHTNSLYGIADFLRGYGFGVRINKKSLSSSTIQFPASFKMQVDGEYRTFRLVQVASKEKRNKLHNGDVNTGFYAAYIMDSSIGSKDSWGGSYMFPGTMPTLKQINDFNKAKAAVEGEDIMDEESANEGRSDYDDATGEFGEIIEEVDSDEDAEELIEVDSNEEDTTVDPPQGPSLESLAKKSLEERVTELTDELGGILENPKTKKDKKTAEKLNAKIDADIKNTTARLNSVKSKIANAPAAAAAQIKKKPEDKEFVEGKLEQMLAKFKKELAEGEEFIAKLQKRDRQSLVAIIAKMVKVGTTLVKMPVKEATETIMDALKQCAL